VHAKAGVGRQKIGLKLILDTGATRTLLHERVIKDLGTREYSASFIQDATGAVTGTKEIVLSRFSLGPFEEKNFAVNIVSYKKAEANYDGLLGMDFLTKHKYQIDYDKQLLVWE
jgi:predicted aspartyl protease